MQAAVNTILDSAAAYVESGTTPRRCAELLARFLLTRFTYTTAEETPDMPAYDLLSSGRAHSLSFASVFYAVPGWRAAWSAARAAARRTGGTCCSSRKRGMLST